MIEGTRSITTPLTGETGHNAEGMPTGTSGGVNEDDNDKRVEDLFVKGGMVGGCFTSMDLAEAF
eukprot:7020356-Pyramimonas_sp.AAC.1